MRWLESTSAFPLCVVYIVTGLPASGKSTFLTWIKMHTTSLRHRAFFFHLDDYYNQEVIEFGKKVRLKTERDRTDEESAELHESSSEEWESSYEKEHRFSPKAWQNASQTLYSDVAHLLQSLTLSANEQYDISHETDNSKEWEREHKTCTETETECCQNECSSIPFVFIEDNMHLISMRERYWRLCRHIIEHKSIFCNVDNHSINEKSMELREQMNNVNVDQERNVNEFVTLPWIALVELRFDTPLEECLRRNEMRRCNSNITPKLYLEYEEQEQKQQRQQQQQELKEQLEREYNNNIISENFSELEREEKLNNLTSRKHNTIHANVSCDDINKEEQRMQSNYIEPSVIKNLSEIFENGYQKQKELTTDTNRLSEEVLFEHSEKYVDNVNGNDLYYWHIELSNKPWALITLTSGNAHEEQQNEESSLNRQCFEFLSLLQSDVWNETLTTQHNKIINARKEITRQFYQHRQRQKLIFSENVVNTESTVYYNLTENIKELSPQEILHNLDLRLRSVVNRFWQMNNDKCASRAKMFSVWVSKEKRRVYAVAKEHCVLTESNNKFCKSLNELIEEFDMNLQNA